MKKIILIFLLTLGILNADKIYLDYTYGMDKKDIPNLKKIDNTSLSPKPYKIYIDDYNQKFIFLNNKLKMVNISSKTTDLKKSIEDTLKNSFRLKKILVKNKYGKQEVANVGELLKLSEKTETESIIFDSFIEAELLFKRENNSIVIIIYKKYMQRKDSDCIKCDEVNGKEAKEYESLEYLFTEKN